MSIGEIDVISVQEDRCSLLFTHVNNYCGRFKLFYLNAELRQGLRCGHGHPWLMQLCKRRQRASVSEVDSSYLFSLKVFTTICEREP